MRGPARCLRFPAYVTMLLIGTALAAESIDAEILKDLDFYQNMGVLENIEFLEVQSEIRAITSAEPKAETPVAPAKQTPAKPQGGPS